MNQLFPLPLYTFLKTAFDNGGFSVQKAKNITPWLIKTILFEPVRWAELALYNQKVHRHTIQKHPLFILGYYRSGTSYLHQCLVQDDRFGYHTNFQMVLPEVMLTSEKTLLPIFEAVCRLFKLTDSVHRVPLSFRFPGEEDATMTTFLDPKGAQWGYFLPEMMTEQFRKYVMFENVPAHAVEAWKKSFLYLLKKISLANHQKQLVLKSPPNTARIKLLLSLFPDAKFIFIHRNPYEVYASNKRFWEVVQKKFALKSARSVDVRSLILDTYSQIMQRYLQEKDLVPANQLTELAYADFVQKPVESLRSAYAALQLDDFGYCENKLKTFTGQQKQFVQLKHALPDNERKLVSEKLEPVIRHWNYSCL
ncbi:MAG TPA: sulfotransferase [Flavisolibacter sp.]|nr:sulfotransferase [Flavisolibacter sp.]